ncbi:MAG: hypothetical protein WCI18_07715 [Pseudomonadota bacterium]
MPFYLQLCLFSAAMALSQINFASSLGSNLDLWGNTKISHRAGRTSALQSSGDDRDHEILPGGKKPTLLSLGELPPKGATPAEVKDDKVKSGAAINSPKPLHSSTESPSTYKNKSTQCPSLAGAKGDSCQKYKELSLFAGLFFADIPGYGASGSYTYNSELNIGSELTLNSLNLKENQDENGLHYRNIALRFLQLGGFVRRKFSFSESFFVKLATSYRFLELGMNGFKSISDIGDLDFSLATRAHYIVLSSSIGNRYKFQNGMILGCEWLGVAMPVLLKKSSSGEYNGLADPELDSASQRLNRAFLKPHLQLMFLSLGRNF